jgi:hypothetical protein
MKNIFGLNVGSKADATLVSVNHLATGGAVTGSYISEIVRYFLLGILIFGTAGIIYYLLLERKKKRVMKHSEELFWKNLK